MATTDGRLGTWNLIASAGMARSVKFVSPASISSLSVWVGGYLDDVDDLTGADEYVGTLSTTTVANDTATVSVDVPATTGAIPLRVTLNGSVITIGLLRPVRQGIVNPTTDTVSLVTEAQTLTLDVVGTPGPGVPTGGTAGQALTKTSGTDYDTGWSTIAANLGWDAATSKVTSDIGTDATLTVVDGTNPGLMAVADKSKLDGIEAGATADQTATEILTALKTVDGATSGLDADLVDGNEASALLARANHTGTQAAATISDFAEAVDDRVAAALVAGTSITITYDDVANTITIAADEQLKQKGNQVKLVYRSATARWEFPDGTVPTLTGRTASITWEGTSAQIPAQGTGDANFKVGDTALVRSTSL